MYLHANAKLGLAGRVALVKAIDEGMSLKAAAGAFSVSPATAHRWWHRWLEASEEARRTLSCLLDRSSRPHRSPRQLAPELERTICACRRRTGWGPRLVAGATGPAPTARSNASTRRWRASGHTDSPIAHIDNATGRCHTGSATTTGRGRAARSEASHRSAAFTTSVGRTASPGSGDVEAAVHD